MKKIAPVILALVAVLAVAYVLTRGSTTEVADTGSANDATSAGDAATPGIDAAADIVIRNARIYTMDPDNPTASSLAIRGDSIVALGHDKATAPLITDNTRVINARQAMLLPGFHDAHVHPLSSG